MYICIQNIQKYISQNTYKGHCESLVTVGYWQETKTKNLDHFNKGLLDSYSWKITMFDPKSLKPGNTAM